MKPVTIPIKGKLKQLFCKHDYQLFEKPSNSKFVSLNDEKPIRVCVKCGKGINKSGRVK
ncbi:hypothetical protein AN1V17_42020 [Vallitalea sediminicola]